MFRPSDGQITLQEKAKPGRKVWRIAALFSVFWYVLLGWLRFYNGLRFTENFTNMNLWPRPIYITLSGLIIALSFTAGFFFMLLRTKFTPIYMKIIGALFLAWLWFDHIALGTYEAFFNQVIVTLLITLATLILAFVLVRKKDYHKERNVKK